MNNLVKKKFNRKKLKKMIDKKDNRKNVIPAINPFDRHFIRKKSNVSKSKHVSTIPKAEEKRKKTLLQEYKKRNNTNKLIDYRIGEKVDISQDEKTLQRLIREKQKQSKKRLYNLNDEELTHTGIKLSEMKSYKNVTDLDMENDGDHNSKIVSSLHFGGFENSSKELNHLNKSKHKTFLEEMISFSKKEKHEKQREKENIDTFREKLDQTWKELRMLIKSDSKINHIDSTKNNQLDTKKSIGKISNDYSYGVESYDLIYHDLQFQSSNNSEVIQREDNSKPVDSNIKKTVSKDENKNSYKKTQIRTYSADALTYDECLNIQPKLTNQFPISDGREEPFILAYDESGKMVNENKIFASYKFENENQNIEPYPQNVIDFDFLYRFEGSSLFGIYNKNDPSDIKLKSLKLKVLESFEHFSLVLNKTLFNDSNPILDCEERKNELCHAFKKFILNASTLESLRGEDKAGMVIGLRNCIIFTIRYLADLIMGAMLNVEFKSDNEEFRKCVRLVSEKSISLIYREFYQTIFAVYPNLVREILEEISESLFKTFSAQYINRKYVKRLSKDIRKYNSGIRDVNEENLKDDIKDEESLIRLYLLGPSIFAWLLYRLVTNSSLLSPKSNHPQTLNYIITNLLDILLKITNTQLSFYANSAIKYPKQNYVQYITNLLGLSLCKSLMYNFNQVDIHSGITDKSDNFHCRAMYFPVLSEYLSGSQNYYIRSLPFCLGAKNNDTKIKDDYNDILLLDILYMPLYEKTFKLSLCNYFKILLKFVSLYDYKEVELSNAISTTNSGLLSSFPEIIKPLIDTLQNKLVPLLDEDYEIKQTTEKIIVKSSDISQKISHKRSSLLSISPEHLVQYFNPLHKTDPINNKCKPKVPNLLEPLIIPANNKFNTKKGGKMKNLAKELIMNDEALKKQGLNNNEKDKIHRTRAKHLLDQRQMLKHVYKRDMKTAKKELRKDATFLSNQKLNEQIERDMIRKTKVKKLYSFLANQEGEVRALKRKKK